MDINNTTNNLSNLLSLGSASPNRDLLEQALSLDAAKLDFIPKNTLLKYITCLGQYLFTIKFAENLKSAVSSNMNRVFENRINKMVVSCEDKYPELKKKTIKEKRAYVLGNDEDLLILEGKVQMAKFEADLVSGMSRPIEEYIQVLKRVLDRTDEVHNG